MQFFKRRKADPEASISAASKASVEDAYERGRLAERARRKGHPTLSVMVFVAALIGLGMVYLGVHEGSFSRGGQVVDRGIAQATGGAVNPAASVTAVNNTGDSLQSQQTVRR